MVTKIDRLARSVADLQEIIRLLRAKGVDLRVLDQPIDTTTAAGKLFYDILSAFGEFETAIRRERQMEGIARAKAKGTYKGRKPKIDREQVIRLKTNGMGPAAIARALKIGRASVYRVLEAS
nr:resolvase, N terminal domain protein [uncultured bacterium]